MGVGTESVWVIDMGAGVEGDPQEESIRDRRNMMVRKRCNVNKVSIQINKAVLTLDCARGKTGNNLSLRQ